VWQDVLGKVAYIGATQFSSGKWIGLVLDEPKVSSDVPIQQNMPYTGSNVMLYHSIEIVHLV
jgi:hypothetical protein